MYETLVTFVSRIALEPAAVIVELLLIGLCVNWVASVLHGTRGTRPLRGVLVMLVVATIVVRVLVNQLGWVRLELLYNYILIGLALIALVVFQPELRRAIIRVGDVRLVRARGEQSQLINALVKSAGYLSKNKYGALIAIQREVDLTGWAENGTLIHAEVSANLLNSIFFPNSALHDLGVIIRGNRVIAANCQFPITESDEIDLALGSRHLAAIGMSYETDALVLVVSEETGVISLADGGKLTRFLSLDDLAGELESRLNLKGRVRGAPTRRQVLGHLWPVLRRGLLVVPLTAIIWYLTDQATLAEASVDIELTIQCGESEHIIDVLEPRSAQRDGALAGRVRTAEQLHVDTARLRASLTGPARQIDRLRRDVGDGALQVRWVLGGPDGTPGDHPLSPVDLKERLQALPAVSERGLSVNATSLVPLRYRVDERIVASLRVQADPGPVPLQIDSLDPASVTATFRLADVSRLLGRRPSPEDLLRFAEERVIRAPLSTVASAWVPNVPRAVDVALDDAVGTIRAASLRPARVSIVARAVGQRRTIQNVVVGQLFAPGVEAACEVQKLDNNEWRIDVEVTGSESALRGLGPADIRAFVLITPEILPPLDAPASERLRLLTVTIVTPPGVELVPGPPTTVRINLVPRTGGGI